MRSPVFFHVDVNSAYLSWSALKELRNGGELDLREIASAVGGDESKRHGVILAKSTKAKQCGVRTGESIFAARKKCPQLVLVRPDFDYYVKNSQALMQIMQDFSPDIEQYSIDEAFLDMTGMEELLGSPFESAQALAKRVREELGFTVNIGISSNRLLAKMASDFEKPDKVHTLFPEEIPQKMWPLPVGELFRVGGSSVRRLNRLGIYTIGDAAHADRTLLEEQMGSQGIMVWDYANGIESTPMVRETVKDNSYGSSMTTSEDVTDIHEAETILLSLTETVAARLRYAGKKASVIAVNLTDTDFRKMSHQSSLPFGTNTTDIIYEAAVELLHQMWPDKPVRLVGVTAGHAAEEEYQQLTLFPDARQEKLKKLDAAMDAVRSRYGEDAVVRARLLETRKKHGRVKVRRRRLARAEWRERSCGCRKDGRKERQMEQETQKIKACKEAKRCGGCRGYRESYEEQLAAKQRTVRKLLDGICPVEPIVGMYYPCYYRNKVHRVFGTNEKGRPVYGMYAEGTHEIVPVKQCLIEDRLCQKIIDTIWDLLPSFHIKTYDEDTQYGFLRHVLVRRGFATGEVMVVIVTADITWPGSRNFVKALLAKHPEIKTVVQNVNNKKTTFLLGARNKVLYGPGQIRDKLLGLTFFISPASFYQINPKQTEVLYRLAIQAAQLTGTERVLDAYCGIGTIGMAAAAAGAGEVIGVELNPDAVRDAIRNARANQLKNVRFVCQDAGDWMQQAAANGQKADVVFLDPPRSGSTPEFITALAKMAPERVVYVSCNPETLARDLRIFAKKGYRAERAWPVDQFPGTGHVETVALLTRKAQ